MSKSQKKILIIANAGFTVLNFRTELIKTLVTKGYSILVVCPEKCLLMAETNLSVELAKLGAIHLPIEFKRSGINPFVEIRLFISLFNILRKIKPNVVLNYTIKPTIYGSIVAKLAGAKYIASNITGIGYVFTSTTVKSKFLLVITKVLYKVSLLCNDLVFFQNLDDKALFSSLGLTNSVRTKVINGSGVDTDKFKRQNFHPRTNSFLFIGRMLVDKGVIEFINAAELLKRKYPTSKFTLLGPIDDNPNSLSSIELEKNISAGIVEYLPPVGDVRPILEEHEIFVLPSYREGTPRSILEAMSMSMPIVTTDVPGCRETVISETNGYLVEVKNYQSLAKAMESFIIDKKLVKIFGDSSRELACKKYDVKKVNESILSEIVEY